MASNPTPKQKSRVTIRIDKSAKSPGSTTLDYRGLLVGEFAPGSKISNLESKDDLIQIKKKKDLEKAIHQLEPSISVPLPRVGSTDKDAEVEVNLTFRSMQDFHPDQVVAQVDDIQEMLKQRKRLKTLKVKMLQDKRMKKLFEDILKSGQLDELMKRLG